MSKETNTRDYLERGTTHDIDEAAQRIFVPALPLHWIPNELKKDYGKDYHIEITERDSRKVTGKIIYVQLKGVDGADYRMDGRVVAHEMKLRHLTYFCDEVKMPVFLVVVDIKARKGYWLFLQEYLADKKDWRSQKTYTLHVPVANDLADLPKLEAEADRAVNHMRVLAATVRERLDFDIRCLEAKDPRFKILPRITRGAAEYQLVPVEPVDFGLTVKGDPTRAAELTDALVGKGQAVHFGPGEVEITGSPLFEEFNEGGGTVKIAHKFEATVTLVCLDEEGNEIVRTSEIPGVVEGGRDEKHFTSRLQQSPFSVEFGPIAQGKGGSVRIHGDPIVWKGQRLLLASYFDLTQRLFTAQVEHKRLVVECRWQGNLIFKVTVRLEDIERSRPFVAFLEIIDKARRIARHFSLDPVYSEDNLSGEEALSQIVVAYDVVFNNSHHYDPGNHTINITLPKSEAARMNNMDRELHDLTLYTDKDFKLPFMGVELPVGQLAVEATNTNMALTAEELQQRLQQDGDSVDIPYVCSDTSSYGLRQLTDEEKSNLAAEGR